MNESTAYPRQAKSTLRSATIVIYATLAINWLCIPSSVANWVDQLGTQRTRAVLLPIASSILRISQISALDRPYSTARELFLSVTGKKDSDDVVDH
jgi:hypothetical protein